MICFYHLDDDGKCAGSVVNQLGQHDSYEDTFIEMNYGFDVPFDRVHKDEIVYIVDFSLDPTDMIKLREITQNIIWIDHHISAIQKYNDFPHEIAGVRSVNHSGCMLTYLFLSGNFDLIDSDPKTLIESSKIPYLVNLCDDYDMWRFNISDTKAFHAGFATVPHGPQDKIWSECTEDNLRSIILVGNAIIQYRADMMKNLVQSYGYESEWNGFKCFVLNQGLISSDDFESIDVPQYDILVGYIYNGNKKNYSYSLRSLDDGPDVRAIAESFGGGGHIHAAGFSSTEMLFI